MRDLAGHRRIGLDSNILIYLLETSGPLADAAARIVDAIDAGSLRDRRVRETLPRSSSLPTRSETC